MISQSRNIILALKILTASLMSIMLVSCASSGRVENMTGEALYTGVNLETEYNTAGQTIVKILSTRNADAFNNVINKSLLLDRTFDGMPLNKHVNTARNQLSSVLSQAGIIMTENIGEQTRLTFVNTRYVNNEHRALMRLDMGDRGMSYIDFILNKDSHGRVRIIDWHDYAQGQLYSSSLRQALVFMLPRDNSLFATILGESWIDNDSIDRFSELANLAVTRNYKKWLEQYRVLPDRLKYSRIILVTRVLIASAAGADSEYRAALKDVCTRVGDDPALSLMLVDHYLNERNYDAAHRALDRLNEYTGGDAAIDLLKANVYLTEKNYIEAIKYSRMAIMEDSSLEDAYWTLLAVSIHADHYETAVDTLRHLERQFGHAFDPDQIANIKGYEKFSSSSIFADWKYGMIP